MGESPLCIYFLIVGGIVCEISPVKISPWSRFHGTMPGFAYRDSRGRHREDLPRDRVRPVSRSVPTETVRANLSTTGIVDERSIDEVDLQIFKRKAAIINAQLAARWSREGRESARSRLGASVCCCTVRGHGAWFTLESWSGTMAFART